MQAQCVLCDQIDNDTYKAKRLRNSRIQSYLCDTCYERIKQKTLARKKTGDFHLYHSSSRNKQN